MNKKHITYSIEISIILPEIVLFSDACLSSSFLPRVSKSSFVLSVEQTGNVFITSTTQVCQICEKKISKQNKIKLSNNIKQTFNSL